MSSSGHKVNTEVPRLSQGAQSPTQPQLPLSSTTFTTYATPRNQHIMTEEEHKAKLKEFVNGLGLNWDTLDTMSRVRAKQFMSADFSWNPPNDSQNNYRYHTTFKKEWTSFCESLDSNHRAWMEDFSGVFFDEKAIQDYLVIRRQKYGICGLHASVVLQHYLQILRSEQGAYNHEMLDISGAIRDSMALKRQIAYIETGVCRRLGSIEFFLEIIGAKSFMLTKIEICMKQESQDLFYTDANLVLEKFNATKEPALISRFRIEQAFHNKCILDYEVDEKIFLEYGKTKGKSDDLGVLHSMVMIGAHKDENTGKIWFLLQNFWAGGYFRLVSAEYMASCEAVISFVLPTTDVSLKQDFKIVDAEYAETDVELEECSPYIFTEG